MRHRPGENVRWRGRDTGHCRRRACPCTHTGGCSFGWVDYPDYTDPHTGETYQQVAPCPVCRPDAADRLAATLHRESVDR